MVIWNADEEVGLALVDTHHPFERHNTPSPNCSQIWQDRPAPGYLLFSRSLPLIRLWPSTKLISLPAKRRLMIRARGVASPLQARNGWGRLLAALRPSTSWGDGSQAAGGNGTSHFTLVKCLSTVPINTTPRTGRTRRGM
jgi:hypothetical protein